MWDLIVSVPDHCLSFYFSLSIQSKMGIKFLSFQSLLRQYCQTINLHWQSQTSALKLLKFVR